MDDRKIFYVHWRDIYEENFYGGDGIPVIRDETTTIKREVGICGNSRVYCEKCGGVILSHRYRYCPHCGRRITGGEF